MYALKVSNSNPIPRLHIVGFVQEGRISINTIANVFGVTPFVH